MPDPICEICDERPAVVFITQIVENTTRKGRYCEVCAREKAAGEGWMSQLAQQWGDESDTFSAAMRAALEEVPLNEILLELFEAEDDGFDELNANPFLPNAFENTFDGDAFDQESTKNEGSALPAFNLFEPEPETDEKLRAVSPRCPNCLTPWETIKRDGRVGCAQCYDTFRGQLGEVMTKVQRGENHLGKEPRAAEKRARRAKNLQTRRENQLQLLKNRLAEAIAAEKYEEAAKLRDKIKSASS
ncbi:UvrB/uvrC motif-containing protein [Abditibacterium utsteinense]|uniref:UvrB/uvrC motif-containing protein n=1 Tax=Abditibacterium utsteinense TaxID=1960156 RepID=A0A2S8SSX5_9BACT|nr:UvrB/UvrC motif-containing protein [Abditibacterium utsteinense]PQV63912.1 UvrB/uvrC motif-containing protein [Abditibacterium utsteinense]